MAACLLPASTLAQEGIQLPDKFVTRATAADPVQLITDRFKVKLWGIQNAHKISPELHQKARIYLKDLLGENQMVRCKVFTWNSGHPVAKCRNEHDIDLGLAMLEAGYVIADVKAITGTPFAESYLGAQKKALGASKGYWEQKQSENNSSFIQNGGSDFMEMLPVFLALILSPLIGFAFVGYICSRGFKHLLELHKRQLTMLLSREESLKEREKFVVASMLEAEINANKVKAEAFLVIYEEMLRNLKDPAKQQKYKLTGEIIQEQPRLARTVFEGNLERLELLGPQLAAEVSRFYSKIDLNPGYVTLEPDYPVEDAVYRVEKVISEAESLITPAERLLSSLQVILRDKKHKGLVPGGKEETSRV